MIEKINDLLKRVEEFKPQAAAEIEEFRVRLLGRKGQLNDILDEFKTVAPEMKRELGQKINTLKTRAIEKINALKTELENSENNTADSGAWIDMSRPAATILSAAAIRSHWSKTRSSAFLRAWATR